MDRLAKAHAPEIKEIFEMTVKLARAGEPWAAREILSRMWPPPKERLVKFEMMKIEKPEDVKIAVAGFIDAVARGILSVSEAEKLVNMASKLGDAIDATEHADIMKQLADKAGIEIKDDL
jgi:hypothetical protein